MINAKTIRNLRIENFQSHELTEMAFDDGLNVIVGASDHGKSAVIRALRWLLYNEPRGSDFIRVGANQCRVTIELADGSRVTRERTPSKNRYLVVKPDGDQQIYEGFGNSVPKEVSDVTGVAKVMLDEDTETALHIGTQLEPPFMLTEPGSIKAKAIGRLNGVHIIDAASRDTQRDLTRLGQEERGYKEQLAEVEAELATFDDVPYLENILLIVEEKQAQLKQMQARQQRLLELRERYQRVQGELDATVDIMNRTERLEEAAWKTERAIALQSKSLRLSQARTKLGQVDTGIQQMDRILLQTSGIDRAGEGLQRSEVLLGRFHRLSRLAATRRDLQRVQARVEDALQKTAHLGDAVDKVQRLEMGKQRLNTLRTLRLKRGDTLQVLAKIDRVLHATSQVGEANERLDLLARKRTQLHLLRDLHVKKQEVDRQLNSLHRILTALQKTDHAESALERLAYLTERQKRLTQMQATLFDVGDRLKKADAYLNTNALELTQMLDQYSEELKRSGTCPVCFTPIDEHTTERLLEEYRGGMHR